ncbi:hypothetical protein [Phaeobacter sp. C3_T13_0]|uniref:hypothetical protein n=1 Tax=Phaeobacter cretensis TaxID=3342641 RepID=UPI0039BC30B2
MNSIKALGAAALALTASLVPAHTETLVFASTNPEPVALNCGGNHKGRRLCPRLGRSTLI